MKTLNLIVGIGFVTNCILAIIIALVQQRYDLYAIAFITGAIAYVALREYWELKKKEQ